jgi:heptosyltransferase-3
MKARQVYRTLRADLRTRARRLRHRVKAICHTVLSAHRANKLRLTARTLERPHVAVVMMEHLGDLVCAQPIARHVAERHPGARVTWLTKAPYAELVGTFPGVDAVVSLVCITEWSLLRHIPLFDQVYDLHMHGRFCAICGIHVDKKVGDSSLNLQNYLEKNTLFDVFCRNAGLTPFSAASTLRLPAQAMDDVDRMGLPERYVVIHARSNEIERDWVDAKWREVVRWLTQELHMPVVEIGHHAAAEMADEPSYRNLTNATTPVTLAEVIRRASIFIGVESGPAHIANAFRKPALIIMGRYRRFHHYVPYNGAYAENIARYAVVADGPAADVEVRAVQERLRALLAERPLPDVVD